MDDIVTRLQNDAERCFIPEVLLTYAHAVDEIERLREIIKDIANAATDEGIKPGYHKQQVNYVRTMWNPLWQAISKAVKEMDNGTSKP